MLVAVPVELCVARVSGAASWPVFRARTVGARAVQNWVDTLAGYSQGSDPPGGLSCWSAAAEVEAAVKVVPAAMASCSVWALAAVSATMTFRQASVT